MHRQLILMGIDPGTTLAYALLNIDGTVIKIDSSKQLDFNSVIRKATAHGNILAVGCDKKKIPDFVQRFSVKAGAKVIRPDHDMLVAEKQQLTTNFSFKNKHEMDALAAAILAFNEIAPTLRRVKKFIKNNNATQFQTELIEAAVKDEEDLRALLTSLIEKPEKPQRIKIQPPESPLKALAKKQGRHITLLQNKAKKLESRLTEAKATNKRLLKKVAQAKSRKQMQEVLRLKDKNIKNLLTQIHVKDSTVAELNDRITVLYTLLASTADNLLVKKMKNLGYAELQKMQALLNIQYRDILFVENPNEISRKTVAFLQGRTSIIIHDKPVSKKIDRELPFIFIDKDKFNMVEEEHFAIIPKEQLSKHLDSKMLFNKIIREYQKERS